MFGKPPPNLPPEVTEDQAKPRGSEPIAGAKDMLVLNLVALLITQMNNFSLGFLIQS